MKILVLQDRLRSGGTERQSVLLAHAFAARGHDITLLTFRPGGALAKTVPGPVQHHALQPFDLGLDWFAPRLHRVARESSPNVVLCMGRMANCYAGGLQSRLPQAVVFSTMRTGKSLPWLFRRSLFQVRHIVANSQDARGALCTRYGVDAAKISVIYNSLVFPAAPAQTATNDRATRDALRTQHGATAATSVLLCVAMFRPEKNQRELIEIVAGLPPAADVQLWLAGDGPARSDCEKRVASGDLGHRVKFVGFHRDPTALYAAADIAVHASWSESLSNFLIEAQAHGLPAVAYAAQGIQECFVPQRTGWVITRGNRDGFRSQIVTLAQDAPVTKLARATEARTYARVTFDPERQVCAYLDLFERLSAEGA